ncbi:CREB-regulated transcription coactivator 1-like isoform X1 [Mytilus galloprovincialis]|uniref:CREB-regulated transcription coactivator 1 n=1 Tax=Mytilus galloprovincialis TaxID=29158 RepID=A0A8B6H6A1_MYTGA|nr:CREB-regulated transcription coactivator 1 [Mytilus galloprovincialis]
MANPRKFSEKIALHNQKQAEETAAFEAIMRDVTPVTKVPSMQKQHLQLQQNISTQYRAGSLPNVNQMVANSGIDLQSAFQHLDDLRQMPNRMDSRFHAVRDKGRPLGPHRRGFPIDKARTNCSPYGSAYLSPPPDTSWRRLFRHLNGANLPRTNSDSAIHTSTMGPSDLDHMSSPTTPPAHRRILEVVGGDHGDPMKNYWDAKKLQSRPKSCEVPNINIYPTEEENHIGQMTHLPITSNTGSLPDLTVVHFQSPLTTPIDAEEAYGCSQGNLSPTSAHMQGMCPQPGSPTQQSPNQRRRPGGHPSPLVLSGGPQSPQMRMPHSPPGSVVNPDPTQLPLDPHIRQQQILYHLQQQQRRGASHHPNPQVSQSHPSPSSNHIQQGSRVPQVCVTACDQNETEPSLSHYRNSVSDSNCQSPTSPRSQTSYSPSQSPGLTPSWNSNSPFVDNFQLQQQQHQTNALQHQFEQFNMSPDNHYNTIETSLHQNGISQQNSITMSQAMGLHQQQQPSYFNPQQIDLINLNSSRRGINNSAQHMTNHHNHHHHQQNNDKIPEIIFTDHRTGNEEVSLDDISTNAMFDGGFIIGEQGIWVQSQKQGADDLYCKQQDFAKELGNAITGMPDGFDTDLFPSVEALKAGLDPLDLQELQLLSDPNNLTDPATEESFKLDRL